MRLFGYDITKAAPGPQAWSSTSGGGWLPIVREPFTGAWQRNIEINTDSVAAFHADFACKTLIARDIGKLRLKLVKQDEDGIWSETDSAAFSPVLRQPNDYQTRNQFWECWLLSKLSRGNTYVLKVRDNREVVVALHVLDPTRVTPLVSDNGDVFYRLAKDNLAGTDDITVPSREIIHDRMNCLYHPLCGTPPVFASGLASMLGLNAQTASALLFQNSSTPGGLITAPEKIDVADQERFKEEWEGKFSRGNYGRVAIMGGGLKYEKISMTHVEGQMIESLKWSAEVVCSVYHVPPYKVGVGALPSYNNVQALNVEYYATAIQSQLEEIEEALDQALGIGYSVGLGTEFDTDNLLRMDSVTQVQTIRDAVGAGVMAPDEGRAMLGLGPVEGGKSPYLQQQNYSLAALAKRDAQADPFAPNTPPPQPDVPADEPPQEETDDGKTEDKDIPALFAKELQDVRIMQRDDIAALAKGMVPFVREVVAEGNVIPPELMAKIKAATEALAEPLPQPAEPAPFDIAVPARSVKGTVILQSGELAAVYSDGSSERLGRVIGPPGMPGEKGAPGEPGRDGIGLKGDDGAPGRDGVSVQGVAIKGGELIVTLSDGSMLTPGRVVPAKK